MSRFNYQLPKFDYRITVHSRWAFFLLGYVIAPLAVFSWFIALLTGNKPSMKVEFY